MPNHPDQIATDRTALRELITNALATHDCAKVGVDVPDRGHDFWDIWQDSADAVLAVLPAVDRAAVLREAADAIQDVIDTDRAYSPARSNDRAALGGARQIVLGLIDEPRREPAAVGSGRAADETQAADLPARLEVALTERFTALGNPFSEMRRHEKGPDGWPASRPVGPHQVAEVLRELIDAPTVAGPGQPETDEEAQDDTPGPRTVCVCGHTRGEHIAVSGRLLCDTCDPDSTDNLVCRGFDAL